MAVEITVHVPAYQHLDNTDFPSNLGDVEVEAHDREGCRYAHFKLPSSEREFAMTITDLKRAIQAIEI